MDQQQYSTLLAALAAVPDPRHARGKQLEWAFILGVIASALLSQQRSAAAIAQWAHEHAGTLLAAFHPHRQRVPSEATIRCALRQVASSSLNHSSRGCGRAKYAYRPMPACLGYRVMQWMGNTCGAQAHMANAPCWSVSCGIMMDA
jgi:hypothetical protein